MINSQRQIAFRGLRQSRFVFERRSVNDGVERWPLQDGKRQPFECGEHSRA